MTQILLQEALCREIEEVCEHMLFQNANGEQKKLKAYEQFLPMQSKETDDSPYAIVRLLEGNTKPEEISTQEMQVVAVEIVIGIHVETHEMQEKMLAHKQILNVIHDICERFRNRQLLDEFFIADTQIIWNLQTEGIEETYPYLTGGMNLSFYIPNLKEGGSDYA